MGQTVRAGRLSFKATVAPRTVKRPAHVRVKGLDRFGRPVKYRGRELLARAFCHEIDHLNGILYEDKVIEWVEDEDGDE